VKKKYLLLSLLGIVVSDTHAQAEVTVYGSFDGGIRRVTNADAGGNSKTIIGSTGNSMSNRLGFRGFDDIGDGYDVHFVLESGFVNGTGALDAPNVLFNRTAIVGIGGAFGTVNVGRQYTVAFRTVALYDPLSYRFPLTTYAALATAGARYNNDIQYAGTLGPLTLRAEYAPGEQAGSSRNGAAKSIGASYVLGSVVLAGAYTKRVLPINSVYRENEHITAGAAFNYGDYRGAIGYADERQETAGLDTRTRYTWVGGEYLISPFTKISAGYYRNKKKAAGIDGQSRILVLAAYYILSVRSSLYAEVDRSKFRGAMAVSPAQTHQTGASIGLNHLF
jgi:predicted porin